MTYKWIGAMLIIAGCGGFGCSLAAGHRREERTLRQLIEALNYMECELQYRLTPLPELCRQTGRRQNGPLRQVFLTLAGELDSQTSPDVGICMTSALKQSQGIPAMSREALASLGRSLGRFDLPGQISGLREARALCRLALGDLSRNRENRLRNYQTLGLCAGAALAIIFL